jgi:hypothetical protein
VSLEGADEFEFLIFGAHRFLFLFFDKIGFVWALYLGEQRRGHRVALQRLVRLLDEPKVEPRGPLARERRVAVGRKHTSGLDRDNDQRPAVIESKGGGLENT